MTDSKFTLIVENTPEFNVPEYNIHRAVKTVMSRLLADAPRGSKCRQEYSLARTDDGTILICTVTLQNMRGTELQKALVISEQPEVARRQAHANQPANEFILCKNCGHDKFYDVDRSMDYNNHICAECGAPAHTLTETGASA